jgi:membrane-bound metal-dependent hydrolase YbcI (DUF457 family)
MFIGHFAVGFGAKKYTPAISLGYLFIAAQFLDLLWPTLLLFGVEKVEIVPGITKLTPLDFVYYPITHSLLMAAFWSLIAAAISWLIFRKRRISLVIGICVFSHWILDLLVHRPDLPLLPGNSTRVGLGLWNQPASSIILECVFFITGVYLYQKVTTAKNKTGHYGFVFLVVSLVAIYLLNIFGPPPPDVKSIAWAGHLQWLFVILAFYVDKNR